MTERATSVQQDLAPPLTDDEGQALLAVARAALAAHLEGAPPPDAAQLFPGPPPAALARPLGTFVTWKRHGRLRGCIGYVSPREPLWQAVRDLAVTAATNDSRFAPITASEVEDLEVSVSVLGAPAPIEAEAVEVGRHGLVIERGSHRGLLLPQVPIEWGWDRESFLARACEKAGLPQDAWRDPRTQILGFEAQVLA